MIGEKETFAERLKRLREREGLTKYRLSKLSGIDIAYLSQLEGGHIGNPRIDTMLALSRGMGVSLAEMAGETVRTPQDALADLELSIGAYIPVFAEVSAGEEAEPIDYVAYTRAKAPRSLRAYRVKGLCLSPEVAEHDTVIVDTTLTPQHGDLVLVILEGDAYLKRYIETEDGKWLENNDGRCQPENVHLHGVVIESMRRWR